MKQIIKWTNRNSHETGYVAAVSLKDKHMTNTVDINDAKKYASRATAGRAIRMLNDIGEGENNDFEIVPVEE